MPYYYKDIYPFHFLTWCIKKKEFAAQGYTFMGSQSNADSTLSTGLRLWVNMKENHHLR